MRGRVPSDVVTNFRPWLAVAFSLLYPGAGHVYLREWGRALLWFGLAVTTSVLVLPPEVANSSLTAILTRQVMIPIEATLALLTITVLCGVDAYQIATHSPADATDQVPTCPHCRREIDPDLEFCHWCTERISRE